MNNIETKIVNNILDDTSNTVDETSNIINVDNIDSELLANSIKQLKLIDSNCDLSSIFKTELKRGPSCGLIIVDNFYNNPMETRNYILTQEFSVKGNYPGRRTVSYANDHLKEIIQKYVFPFGGNITEFPCPNPDNSNTTEVYNGSFQYTTSRDRSWVHTDSWNNWAGVLYLTPNAPLTSGTAFYKFRDGAMCQEDGDFLKNKEEVDRYSQDLTKWKLVDVVGNVFNRLILFNAHRYHMSMDYFGDTKENGRLFQTFFFSTEK